MSAHLPVTPDEIAQAAIEAAEAGAGSSTCTPATPRRAVPGEGPRRREVPGHVANRLEAAPACGGR
jgi:hypothetical protein